MTEGRNNMPALSTLLTPVDIRDVAAYVAETSREQGAAD